MLGSAVKDCHYETGDCSQVVTLNLRSAERNLKFYEHRLQHRVSASVLAKILYSASVLDQTLKVCFLNQAPYVDVLTSGSNALSASQKFRIDVFSARVAFCMTARCMTVPFRYQSILLRSSKLQCPNNLLIESRILHC